MTDISTENNVQKGNTPLEQGKKSLEDMFEEHKKPLMALTFISTYYINKIDEYLMPKQDKFLFQRWNRTFLINKSAKKITLKLLANFVVTEVRECMLVYNDLSNKKPSKYYIINLKNDKGRIEKNVEIANNSKSDIRVFETTVNNLLTGFTACMKEAEFKAFITEYISPNVSSSVTIYTNAGVLSNGVFLYENAFVTKEEIFWSDEDGYIKTGDNTYIRLAEATHYLPKLAKSDKTGIQITNELITNIIECWDGDIVTPLITLGHIIMSLYYNEFTKRYGVPTLILHGETGTGKSTLITVGLSMFGLAKEAMTSGGSTVKSNEYFSSKYNGMIVCIDDVKGETLQGSNFTALVKGIYKGIARTRMLPYGRGVEYIHACSPTAYSTNEALPDLKEVINRMNVIEVFGKSFKADKFNYHELNKENSENLKELSLILLEFIKMPYNEVINLYEQVFEMLKASVSDIQQRVINNIAYAYTGALLLLSIANIRVEDLEKRVIDFTKSQVLRYENIKTPVDKVLSEIIVLATEGSLIPGTHFKIFDVEYEDKLETHIRFRKEVVISLINKFYAYDKTKHINENSFLTYAQNDKRFRGNNVSVRYDNDKSKVVSSICFDISGMDEFVSISKHGVFLRPYQKFKAELERNKK